MSDRDRRGLVQIGLGVLKTVVSTAQKRIYAQLGNYLQEGGGTDSSNVEWWQHVGFISQPSNPDAGKAGANAIIVRCSGNDAVIASQDARGLELAGQLKPGETCVYAPGADGKSQGRTLYKADGSVTTYSRAGNDPGGGGIMIQLDAKNDAIRLLNSKGYGIIIDSDGVQVLTDKSAVTVGSDGHCSMIATAQCQCDGSTVVLGSIAVPVANSVCVGAAGLIAVASGKVFAAIA